MMLKCVAKAPLHLPPLNGIPTAEAAMRQAKFIANLFQLAA